MKLKEISPNKIMHQGLTNVWQFEKPKRRKNCWYVKYAQKMPNPDERLLPNFRGKGY